MSIPFSIASPNSLSSDAASPFLETPNKVGRLYVLSSGQLSYQEKKYPFVANWEDTYKNVIWTNPSSTSVALTAPYRLTMESNGDLTFKNSSNAIIWNSNTGGQGVSPYTFEIRNSGEMVVKDSRNTILWNSQTFFSFYLVDDARLVGYFNSGALKSYDYTNKTDTNRTIRNIKNLSSTSSKATIEGSFTISGDFVIRLNNFSDGYEITSSGVTISSGVTFRTISFWVYIHDVATSTLPTCLVDIPDVGTIASTLGVTGSLQSGMCMIDAGAQQGLTLGYAPFQKKGKWTNITIILNQAVNTDFILFNT